ncbi:hypothetical protein FRC06_005556 [Ceratobasidium sp. 370]|nr:hypothetical protein FRC06_005556 [Ceratobasidium sp. 370]
MPAGLFPRGSRTISALGTKFDDPDDKPGAEMAEDARVWETYVKETDAWDRDMIAGRIEFIIESLGDLKPDPAEASAQTLLIMSQTLAAIANGQPVSMPTQGESNSATFSPSRSAVVVNVLWVLSLGLSLHVSLVAMLGRDWSYMYMSGRSGGVYDRARRRQEKWDGMQRWKMRDVLAALPLVMHMAIFLFAAGLCVYLWDVNTSVAVPFTFTTASTACFYSYGLIMPLLDESSPYAIPGFVNYIKQYLGALSYIYSQLLKSTLQRVRDSTPPEITSQPSDWQTSQIIKVPMDIVTSRMIIWLIENCEDRHIVDTALQALAGADNSLPLEPLGDKIFGLAWSRLTACTKPDPRSQSLSADDLSQLSVALRYSRACFTILPHCSWGRGVDRWDPRDVENLGSRGSLMLRLWVTHMGLLKLALRHQASDAGTLAITAVSAATPICHWTFGELQPQLDVLGEALNSATAILAQHFENGGATLPAAIIHQLAQSSTHYLVALWPRERSRDSNALLPILLARVATAYYKTTPDTARTAAVTLAATAFACNTYPGGEEPPLDDNAREKRAVDVLRHYQTHQPDQNTVVALFLFGFFGVLPRCATNGHDTQLAAIIPSFINMLESSWLPHIASKKIWSIPPPFPLRNHILTRWFECFSFGAHAMNDELARVLAHLLDLVGEGLMIFSLQSFEGVGLGTHIGTLLALCFVKSRKHQEFFMKLINAQRIPDAPLQQLKSNHDHDLLCDLCHTLLNTRTARFPVAAVHFGLLVASVISSTGDSLNDRRSALRPLLRFQDRFPDPMRPKPFVFEQFVSHLEQCITEGSTYNSLGHTMQFVVDFCGTDWTPDMGSNAEPTGGTEVDWWGKLQELKNRYRPTIGRNDPSIEEIGYPPVEVPAEVTVAISGTTFAAAETSPNWCYPSDSEWCC